MKTMMIHLPAALAADIEREARERKISKSDVVRERLERAERPKRPPSLEAIADLIGRADALPSDLGARKKYYLKKTGYGAQPRRPLTRLFGWLAGQS